MIALSLKRIQKNFYCVEYSQSDHKLDILEGFLSDLGFLNEYTIENLKNRSLCGGNVSIISYADTDIIYIRNQWDSSSDEILKINKENLYELIRRWSELWKQEVKTITLMRDGDNYFIEGE